MQKVFDTPTPATLYVEIGSGDVRVHAQDVSQTTVNVTGKGADDTTVEQRGDEIVVLGPQRQAGFFGSGHDLDVVVTCPQDSRLATKLGSADLVVDGRTGECRLKTGSGEIRLEVVDASALIEAGSGDITVGAVSGDLRAKAGSGDVRVERIGGNASIATGSGEVQVGTTTGNLEVKSGSGDLRVREAHQDVNLTTASGELVIELVDRGQVAAKNVSGDIRVGIPSGIPVWTDVNTVTGSVRSALQGAGQPEQGQDFVELRAKTVSGDIYLEQR